ncbi:MAG: S46 family peptidase [Candidatus Cryptobacteroides sp.]
MNRTGALVCAIMFAMSLPARADEGLWLVNDVHGPLEGRMRECGLQLSAAQIYNPGSPEATVSDAVVLTGSGFTGSLVSRNGLILTSYSCAYPGIARASTPENNYLENGFWAASRGQELPLPGETVSFLKKSVDVTSEVKALKKELGSKGQGYGADRIRSVMEQRYADSEPGLEARFSSMYSGERCIISFYKVYSDVRLVAAPPSGIGCFGGSAANSLWPHHSCDFAIFRIYEKGLPVTGEKPLRISRQGYSPFSFTMVLGYPLQTGRYSPSGLVRLEEEALLPVWNSVRGPRIAVLRKWMSVDPAVRLKYAPLYRTFSWDYGRSEGRALCYKRFQTRDNLRERESGLQDWISSEELYGSMWESVVADVNEAYSELRRVEKDRALCSEILSDGLPIGKYLLRAALCEDRDEAREILSEGLRNTDTRVERELLELMLTEFYTDFDSYYYGKWQKKMQSRFGTDFRAMAAYLWENSIVSSELAAKGLNDVADLQDDPLVKFLSDTPGSVFDRRHDHLGAVSRAAGLKNEYERALYWMGLTSGRQMYPDANSTLRISYGKVAGYMPSDGIICNWYSTPGGFLERSDRNNRDLRLDRKSEVLLGRGRWGRWGFTLDGKDNSMIANFLSDNDVAEGNSGSPVLDAKGGLVGIVSDGNYESLASAVTYSPGYSMCISTDIRFVMWVLDKYAGMKRLVKEMEFAD